MTFYLLTDFRKIFRPYCLPLNEGKLLFSFAKFCYHVIVPIVINVLFLAVSYSAWICMTCLSGCFNMKRK